MNKYVITTAVLLFALWAQVAGGEEYIYDTHGKRDPFVPLIGVTAKTSGSLEDIISVEDVKLQGVAIDSSGKRVAIINGEMLNEGKTVGKLTLKHISADSITIIIDEEQFKLNIYQEADQKGG